jgi:hypothetical protein
MKGDINMNKKMKEHMNAKADQFIDCILAYTNNNIGTGVSCTHILTDLDSNIRMIVLLFAIEKIRHRNLSMDVYNIILYCVNWFFMPDKSKKTLLKQMYKDPKFVMANWTNIYYIHGLYTQEEIKKIFDDTWHDVRKMAMKKNIHAYIDLCDCFKDYIGEEDISYLLNVLRKANPSCHITEMVEALCDNGRLLSRFTDKQKNILESIKMYHRLRELDDF